MWGVQMYYVHRAHYVLRKMGALGLIKHSFKFIKYKFSTCVDALHIVDTSKRAGKANANGSVSARTLPDNVNQPIYIPYDNFGNGIRFDRVAVVAHIFYPEVTGEIIQYLKNIPIPFGLFITTDTVEKKAYINDVMSSSGLELLEFEIRVTPNRGRDIAPKYVGFRDVYERYDAFLHIHSKKSAYNEELGTIWRRHLFTHLIGSKEITQANLEILSTDNVGIVYPEHLRQIKKHIDWGYNFPITKELLERIGVTINFNTVLEFPSGSMFWGRSEAIRRILDLNLDFTDFPRENSQIDGTLAHAIERALLFFVEGAGQSWARVTIRPPKKLALRNERKFVPLTGSELNMRYR
ncbi:rhamnan synthesis F family protein [Brucella sp. RRSP16]|uniref:rhamnan synthesis F family protein n=1 Tax=Brucella sp. RRSP16 TaxID=3453707 RepID=UPI003FCC7585